MFAAVDFSELSYLSIHEVFPGHVEGVREMIHFLVFIQALVDILFNWTYLPVDSERPVGDFNIVFGSLLASALDYTLTSRL